MVLGHLNFSSGAFDPAVWHGWSELFAAVEPVSAGRVAERPDAASHVFGLLRDRVAALEVREPAFRDSRQARRVLDVLAGHLLPGYRAFHADLLEHQPPGAIERPFFVAAAAQALLATVGSWDDAVADGALRAAVADALGSLNDYVGWRPVAVLENGRLSAPYPHERVRPIPLFVAGAGPAHGRYRDLVAGAVEILAAAPPRLLEQADFDLALLEELAIDPRAFDFLHPAASRPNYLFGLWDPERIDSRGLYRRMVVQQTTLDGILSWPEAAAASREPVELARESAAVLAGVMLMASGLSGRGPGGHHAGLPLAELLPRIAGYRDEFYRWLLGTLPADHRRRLEEEMQRLRQPFGGVRRHINALLAGRRARQVENVALAAVLARLGRAAGAERFAGMVPAASARMFARITSHVVGARRALAGSADGSGADDALGRLDAATELVFRAVACGAAVDPWNILGLGGQFPLHEPGGESLADPRVDDLVAMTESILEGYAAVWRTSSLDGPGTVAARASAALERLASWWDRHATTTVSGVPHLSGRELLDSTREVIAALERRRAFAAAPPPSFWRREVGGFSSPESHAQAAAALLDEDDLDGASGLLVHWASLLEGEAVERSGADWLAAAARWTTKAVADASPQGRARLRRFLELVEANTSGAADCLERFVGQGDPSTPPRASQEGERGGDGHEAEDQPDDEEERVASAYESMVWRDSADDGVDGGMLDAAVPAAARGGGAAELERAAEFLAGVCRLLRHAVTATCAAEAAEGTAPTRADVDAALGWRHTLKRLRRTFLEAADRLAATAAPPPPGMPPAEYDRERWQRDAAVERLVDAAVQATEASWILSARVRLGVGPAAARGGETVGGLFAAILAGDAAAAGTALAAVVDRLGGRPVLYVPLSRGGRPHRIARARSRERLLERLVACLPRLGLVAETSALVHLAKALESRRPPGAASVSEFDRVFEAATAALVERIVESAAAGEPADSDAVAERILAGLALLVPRLLDTWMTHARQLRLSVLERVRDPKAFAAVREFVEQYGAGLFTQHLLAPPSLRGVLRGGARRFLEQLVERHAGESAEEAADGRPRFPHRLVADLEHDAVPIRQAAGRLRLVLECIAENHAEYRDWNSTTTQSDRGEHLHILLDFLRIKAEYDRIAWTLRPVNVVHRVLTRRGLHDAAAAWRGRMRDETRDTAADLADRLAKLEAFWGVRLASVADRVGRPFTTVLEQDELEALVEPAVFEAAGRGADGAGAALEARAERMLGLAGGSGVEVPEWLERLGAAVERAAERTEAGAVESPRSGSLPAAVPWLPLAWDALAALLAKKEPPRAVQQP
ncbi:MAG: hypothetical protein EBZ74_03545 [Planctomycetia bacterium]|nr:hypothetical protein [Planctomycetia bacterium]